MKKIDTTEVEVELTRPHMHRDVLRPKGVKLTLPKFRAERLVNPDNTGRPEAEKVRPCAKYVK